MPVASGSADGRMIQLGGNQLLEFGHELMDALGRADPIGTA